jgi:hypothetical protein
VSGTLSGVVRTLQGWVGRRPGLRVRLDIDSDVLELSGAPAGQQLLVDEWLARHPAGELSWPGPAPAGSPGQACPAGVSQETRRVRPRVTARRPR